jgi:hypothetical protein
MKLVLVDPMFQVPKFDNENENEDKFSTKFDRNVKRKGPNTSY